MLAYLYNITHKSYCQFSEVDKKNLEIIDNI